ncbi:hypothetical protein FNV43_RR25563 [Rhamnella rubrinervis]|uniref:NAC domain-containing protein n=1 Tax=Rhamnella rubrinervis TaxID=2594499 RepID=A0A8K0DVC5_9ROSA|nr:hypothetical protein FNV43_RR25563 [Rhamnella rubrinervis]
MAIFSGSFVVSLLSLVLLTSSGTTTNGAAVTPSHSSSPFNRTIFPPDFIFGAGSSAYQIEGAANLDGKGPSNWDTFTKNHPDQIKQAGCKPPLMGISRKATASSWCKKELLMKSSTSTGGDQRRILTENIQDTSSSALVTADFYHRYKEDIQLMKKIGLDSFRFSISWSRVLPTGKINGGVNQQGVQFYNNLINELLSNGIMPFVTIFHWDVPQALDDEYGGFLNSTIVKDYQEYAEFLFKTFGDRVKNWCTVNEPSMFALIGYDVGLNAPGRCSDYVGNCTAGNSAIEPYIVAHNLLLAHSAAVKVYREKYQVSQNGEIGITLVTDWYKPKFNTQSSRKAASRALDFSLGWFLHPITFGDYPQTMQSILDDRLPKFTKYESDSLKGSFDFLGMNYYTANYVEALPPVTINHSYYVDIQANFTTEKNGVAIGEPTHISNFFMYPRGIQELLIYIKDKYKNPPVYITENGVGDPNTIPFIEAIKDNIRIRYLQGHLLHILKSIKEGANVKAYYVWSFLDDFEWASGYTIRYGLTYIDFKNNLERHLNERGMVVENWAPQVKILGHSSIGGEHGGLKLNKGEELYFFTKLKKLSINGSRFNRHTPSGTWSGVNRVSVGSGTGVADKRYLKYENRRSTGSENDCGCVTWKMYEYNLVDGGADPTVVCRLRREVKGQKRKLTDFIPTHPYFCSSLSSPSVGDHHHRQQRIKKQRIGGNLHADAADDVIDFGFLFDSDDEQDLKEITREEYINKAAAVNVVKSPRSTTHHHQVDVVEEHSTYGGTENLVESDDDDDHGINNVAKSLSTSTTGGQDSGDQIIFSEDDNDALLKLIFEITDEDEKLEKILPINYSDDQDLNEVTREEKVNNAAVNFVETSSSTTHRHQVDVIEEQSSNGGTGNFVETDNDDHGINNVAKSSSVSSQDHGDNIVSKLSSSTASTSHQMEDENNNNNVVGDQVDYNIGAVEQQNGMEAEDYEEYLSGKSFAELLQSVPLYYEEHDHDDAFMAWIL